jgi:RNA polymerase sigma-70 factor (ECF subfamily)
MREGDVTMEALREWIAVPEGQGQSAEELALLRAARAGDLSALDRLVALHQEPVFALCRTLLGHVEDGEDAAQEVFLRAFRALPRFRGESTFRTWLFRIAVNLCRSWKRRHRATEPWDEAQPGALPAGLSPENAAICHLQLQEALDALRPHYRAILLLKEQEGWSMAEIGAALGWSERQVQNALYRARRALLDWRQRHADEGEER